VDPVAGAGPLRGLLTALEDLDSEFLVAITVDMPLVEASHLAWLLDQIEQDPQAIGVMLDGTEGGAARIEPFPSVYRRKARELIAARDEAGERSVRALSRQPRIRLLRAPHDWSDKIWTSLNTPADLAHFSPKAPELGS